MTVTFKVHYKGYKAKYDEWLDASLTHPHSSRIAPLHRHTRPKWPLPDWPVVPLTADGELAAVLPVAACARPRSGEQRLPMKKLTYQH